MTDTSGSPKGVEADLWSKPDETINEKIKDLCPIVITTIDCRAKDDNKYEFDKNIEGDENNDYAHFFTNVGVARKEGGAGCPGCREDQAPHPCRFQPAAGWSTVPKEYPAATRTGDSAALEL